MNYTITESEYNTMGAVRGQLGLVADLLTARDANTNLFDASDLYDFLAAQINTIRDLLTAIEARYDAAKDQNNKLSFIDWYNMLQVVSGRRAMRSCDLKALGQKLQNSVMVDPDMEYVFNLWKDVMTNDGEWPFSLEPSSTDGFNIQFPVRAAVAETAAPSPKTTAKVPAPRKRDKLTATAP